MFPLFERSMVSGDPNVTRQVQISRKKPFKPSASDSEYRGDILKKSTFERILNSDKFKLVLWLGFLATIGLFVLFLLIILLVPIGNYYHTQANIELKNKRSIVAEFDGIIEKIYVENGSLAKDSTVVLRYSSRENDNELAELQLKEQFFENELSKLQNLQKRGYVSIGEVELKKLELAQLETKIKQLSETTLRTPSAGRIFYTILPEEIAGSYISKGQVIAYLFSGDEKHIHITFPISHSDKIILGTKVIVRYKDPSSLKALKIEARVYQKELDIRESNVHLYCNVVLGEETLKTLPHATPVGVSVLVNKRSIMEDLFKVELLKEKTSIYSCFISPSIRLCTVGE